MFAVGSTGIRELCKASDPAGEAENHWKFEIPVRYPLGSLELHRKFRIGATSK
jgi:hypothetical protein